PLDTIKAPTSWLETRNEPLPPETEATMIAASTVDEFPPEVRPFVQDPNRQINQYILVKVLGKGGMGEVWKAWDRKLSRWGAIKFLLGQSQEGVARFKREAKMAARLTHPNIAPVHEVGEAPSRQPGQPSCHFLAMEYIDGTTLGGAKLSMRDKVDVFVKVAQGIDAAHKGGIVHRDIKPANVMLTKENWPYVMDFGLAKSLDGDNNLSASGAIMGTPAFMPPEQVEGLSDQIGPWSDVYSLGATMYAVFCGVYPFTAQTTLQLLQKVVNESPSSPRTRNPEISAELETIILKAMAKKKEDRYQTAAALADVLKRVLVRLDAAAMEPAAAPVVSPSKQVVATKTAPVWPIVAGLFVLLTGAVMGAGWWWMTRPVDKEVLGNAIEQSLNNPQPSLLPKDAPKPRVPVEPKPEAKVEVKPDVKPLLVPLAKPDLKPEVKPEALPEAKPIGNPTVKPELKPRSLPEVKPEVKAVLPAPDVRPAATTAEQVIQKGFDYLGARYQSAEFATDSDAWAALALLRAASSPKLVAFLKSGAWEQSAHATTAASLRTLALAAAGDRERTAEGAHYLVQAQGKNGLWADGARVNVPALEGPEENSKALLVSGDPRPKRLEIAQQTTPGPDGDLAATPLALLALSMAEASGHRVPADTWRRALDGVEGKGSIVGTFLCRQMLGDPDAGRHPAIQAALKGIGPAKDRPLAAWVGIEQIGSLLSTPRFGDYDWYAAGAQALAASQQPDGSWVDGGDPVKGTAEALLFLTKGTAALQSLVKKGGAGRLELKSLGGCTNLMFVLDASGRMRQELGDQERFQVAKDTIAKLVEKLPEGSLVGLRIYGSRLRADEPGCETDSTLLIPPQPVNKRTMLGHLAPQQVKGWAPLTYSLIQTLQDLSRVPKDMDLAVVLLVDGKDTDRRSNPVPAVGDLAGSHPGMKVHVVGFETEDEDIVERLKAMAASGGGVYIPATNAKEMQARLTAATVGEQDYEVLNEKGESVLKGRLGDSQQLPDGVYTVVCGRARQKVWITPGLTTRIIVDQAKLAETK
ncbi:MAG TPA: protein kinase, partial [Planctomycetota bacterium]|nr:protein kinase [Planctomycetota bacterium]